MKIQGNVSFSIDSPGDLHFINCLFKRQRKPPICAGYEIAKKIDKTVVIGDEPFTIEKLICPESCPRTEKDMKERCKIEYWGK